MLLSGRYNRGMRWPSWNEFTIKIGDFEKSANDVISNKIEKFQNNHPLVDKAIRTSIKFLPSPFDNIGEVIYDSSKDSDEGVEEVKNFLNDLQRQGQEHYKKIISKLDIVSIDILDIKTSVAKEDTLQLIKQILISKDDLITQKLNELRNYLDEVKRSHEKLEKEIYQSYGLTWLAHDYFETHKSSEKDFDNWKKGFSFDLPSIKGKRELRRERITVDIKSKLEQEGKLLITGPSGASKSIIFMEIICDYFEDGFQVLYSDGTTSLRNPEGLVSFIEDLLRDEKKLLIAVDNAHDERTSSIFYVVDKLSTYSLATNLRFLITARMPEFELFVKYKLDSVREGIRKSIRKLAGSPLFRYKVPFFSSDDIKGFIKLYEGIIDREIIEKRSQEIYDYTKGDPIMVMFSVFGQGLDKDVEEMYDRYLRSEQRIKTMLICSLLDISNITITDAILSHCGVLKEANYLNGATLYRNSEGSWRTKHPRWDEELFSFLYNEISVTQAEDRMRDLKDSLIALCSMKKEDITLLAVGTLYSIAAQGFLPIDLVESLFRELISQLPTFLSDKKKSSLYTSYIADAYYQLKKYQEAIDKLDEALALNPRNTTAYSIKGLALMKFRRYHEAVECFDKALEIDPQNAYDWMNRGNALDDLGKHKEAIISYRKALDAETDSYSVAEIWTNLGLCYFNLKDFEEAEKCYDNAVGIENYEKSLQTHVSDDDTKFVMNHTMVLKGNLMLHSGRYREAMDCYDEALKINPGDAETWLNKGLCLIDLGKYQEGIKLYLEALGIRMDPRLASMMLVNLGMCYYYLGDYRNARAYYNRAIETDAENAKAYYNVGIILDKLGQNDAQKYFDKAKELGLQR